jgi:hypothetical protein
MTKRAVILVLAILFLLIVAWPLALHLTGFHLANWMWVHTGTGNEPGSYYGFWSGFGSDLGEYVIIVGLISGIYHAAKKSNCHTHGCWRIGSHPVGDYKVCKHCHLLSTGTRVTIEHLQEHHLLHHRAKINAARGMNP